MMYVLTSFIEHKYKINNSDYKEIKIKESYQNMIKEINKNNNDDKTKN